MKRSSTALKTRFTDFVKAVQEEVVKRGWVPINKVPKDGVLVDWIPNYAQFSLEELKAHVLTYVGQPTRQAQNSFAMYQFLRTSLDPTYFASLAAGNSSDYTINGDGSGVLLLKTILTDVHHDLKGKGSAIRDQLIELPKYMAEVKYDLTKFNAQVNMLMESLKARGQTSTDIVHYLWKAYAVVPDANFLDYVKKKKDDYDEGKEDYTYKQLLKLTLDKSATMKSLHQWLKDAPEHEQIIALVAQVDSLKLQLQDNLKRGAKGPAGPKQPRKPKANKDQKPKAAKRDVPAWKNKKTTEVKVRTDPYSSKQTTYYWCPHHKYYTAHKPVDCRLKGNNPRGPPPSPRPAMAYPASTPAAVLARLAFDEEPFEQE